MQGKIEEKKLNTGTMKTGLMLSTISFIILGISLIIYASGAFLMPTLMAVLLVLVVATEIFSVAAFYLMFCYVYKNDMSKPESRKGIWIGFILTAGAFLANTIVFLPILITGKMF